MKALRRLFFVCIVQLPAALLAQGRISGTVFDSLSSRAPLANATVVLVERSRYATTDADGRFIIDSVPPGKYTIGFSHPMLDSLDLSLPPRSIEVGTTSVNVLLATPSAATAYAWLCPRARAADTGVILGRIRDVDDNTGIVGASITTDWTEFVVTGARSSQVRRVAVAASVADGAYFLCGVPTNVPLELRAELAGAVVGPLLVSMNDRLMQRADFSISTHDSASMVRRGNKSVPGVGVVGTAQLRGTVKDADTDKPIRNAQIAVVGTQRTATTDAAGAFVLRGIPAGTRALEIRTIGYLPVTFTADFATNDTRDTTLAINRRAQNLERVTVKAKEGSMSLLVQGGFDTRRAQGLGKFITQQDVERHPASSLTDVLAGAGNLRIEYGKDGFPMPYLRGGNSGKCIPNYFLDNMHIEVTSAGPAPGKKPFTDLSDFVKPEYIKGIEVYSNSGTIPAQFDLTSSTGCGSIVIWTR
jgi:hypothetical protein